MRNIWKKIEHKETAVKIVTFLIIASSFGYNIFVFWTLREKNFELESNIELLTQTLSAREKDLLDKSNENSKLNQDLSKEKNVNEQFKNQIDGIKSSVGVLEKLSQIDPELLKKYSKVYFLNENYTPPTLTAINPEFLHNKDKETKIHSQVHPHLDRMLNDAKDQNIDLLILSAFRSFGEQASLKSAYKVTYGSGANAFSADQGYSEHQLGTTLDFTTSKQGAVLTGFEKTDTYKWLLDNAHKYGFIISYPKENSYYIFEPWHWRYIGVYFATKLKEENLYFYSMDQRIIDQYLIGLFD